MADQNNQGPRKPIPGTEKMEEDILKIDEGIKVHRARLDELQKEIDSKETGKEEYFARRTEMQTKLDQYDEMIKHYEGQKQAAWSQIDSTEANARSERDRLNKEKSKLKFKTVQDIDNEVARIEMRMRSESFTAAQERKLISEISQLKATKPQIAKVQALESTKGNNASETGDVKEKISYLNQNLNDARDAKRAQMDQLRLLNDKRTKERSKVDHLFQERTDIRNLIKKANEEKRSQIDEKREFEKIFRAKQAEDRALKSEKMRVNRLKREADDLEYKINREEQDWEPERPRLLETTRLEQMIRYCKNLVGETFEQVEETKAEVVHDQPKGFSVLASKKDRTQGAIVIGAGKKVKKEKVKAPKNDKIKHNVDSLQMFSQFKLNPPLTTSDVPPLIEALEEQLEKFMVEVKEWEAKVDERKAAHSKKLLEQKKQAAELKKKADLALAQIKGDAASEE